MEPAQALLPIPGRVRPLGIVVTGERVDVDQAAGVRYIGVCFTVEQQLVLEGLTAAAAMHQQVFQLGEPRQVDSSTAYRPSGCTHARHGG
jgi:hypothetical protein